jgi:hypothetical protein
VVPKRPIASTSSDVASDPRPSRPWAPRRLVKLLGGELARLDAGRLIVDRLDAALEVLAMARGCRREAGATQ